MRFENADTEILCSSRTSAIVSPGGEAQFGRNASVSVMALSNPHNLDASDFAPVYLSPLINRVLHVVRGKFKPYGPSSLENNLVVVEILDAARESVRTGKTITLAR